MFNLQKSGFMPTSEGKPVFMINGAWFAKWKDYVKFTQINGLETHHSLMEEEVEITFLGPIDQSSILEDIDITVDPSEEEDYTNYPVKLGLTENKHYVMASPELWQYLHGIYGGVTIPRFTYYKSENDVALSVEIWLQKVRIIIFAYI